MSITAEDLFKLGRLVEESDIKESPYLFIAYNKRLSNYKYITYGDILSLRGRDVPEALIKFMSACNSAVMIANKIDGKVVNVYFRSLKEKKFYYFGVFTVLPYGLGMLSSDFCYGDPLILVEGILDRDSLVDIYPNVIAVLSAGTSVIQLEILLKITNSFYLLYDNDESGKQANSRDRIRFEKRGVDVKILKHFFDCKDTGEIIKAKYDCGNYRFELLNDYYKSMINLEVVS